MDFVVGEVPHQGSTFVSHSRSMKH
jgi:hypothetical protein